MAAMRSSRGLFRSSRVYSSLVRLWDVSEIASLTSASELGQRHCFEADREVRLARALQPRDKLRPCNFIIHSGKRGIAFTCAIISRLHLTRLNVDIMVIHRFTLSLQD